MSIDLLQHSTEPFAVFDRRDDMRDAAHEQFVFCRDRQPGLRAIIAIHDTTLGPGRGSHVVSQGVTAEGSPDSGPATALGVVHALEAAACVQALCRSPLKRVTRRVSIRRAC